MKLGQNVYFDDRNMIPLPFFTFFEKFPIFPDFPIFPQKWQFWVNFDPKFPIGKPNQQLQMFLYHNYYSISINW